MSANGRSPGSGPWPGLLVAALLLSACAQDVSPPASVTDGVQDAAAARREARPVVVAAAPARPAERNDPPGAAPAAGTTPAAAAPPREARPAPADTTAETAVRTSRPAAPEAERPASVAAAGSSATAEAANRGMLFALSLFGAVLFVMVAWMARFESRFPAQLRELREQLAQPGRSADSSVVQSKADQGERLAALEKRMRVLEGRLSPEAPARTSSVAAVPRPAMPAVSARPDAADVRSGAPERQREPVPARGTGEVDPADTAFLSANAGVPDSAAMLAGARTETAVAAEPDPAAALQRLLVGIQMAADVVLAEGRVRDMDALTQEIAARLLPEHERALRAQGWRVGAHGASSGPDYSNPKVLSVTKSDGRGWLIPNRRVLYNYNFVNWFSGDGRQWPNFRQAADCTVDAAGYVSVQQHCLGKL